MTSANCDPLLQIVISFSVNEYQKIVDDRLASPVSVNPAAIDCILRSVLLAEIAVGVDGENVHLFKKRSDDDITFGIPLQPALKEALLQRPLEKFFAVIKRSSTVADMSMNGIVVLDEFQYNATLHKLMDRDQLLHNTVSYIAEHLLKPGNGGVQILSAAITQLPSKLYESSLSKTPMMNAACDLSEWWTENYLPGLIID